MTKELRISIAGRLACLLLLVLAGSGCRKVPNGGVPIYLRVDSPTVVDDGVTGSATYKIPDVWAESGATTLGAYEMPVTFPILTQGAVPILLSAGIYDNGIVSSRAAYPFYRPDTFTIPNAVPGGIYVHHPVYHYFASTQHAFLQSFVNGTGMANMTVNTTDDADSLNPNKGCGEIHLGTADTIVYSIQTIGVPINTNGREAYIEMDFKQSDISDHIPFDVGLRATASGGGTTDYPLITIFPDTRWKKTYLNFSSFVGNNAGSSFQIYLVVYKNPGISGSVYIDNLKLLYFN